MAERYKKGEAPWEKNDKPPRYKVGEAPWEKQDEKPPSQNLVDGSLQSANAALNGAVNAGVLGYLPQIEGAVSAVPSLASLDSSEIQDAYVKGRDEAAAYQESLQKNNPYAYGSGSIAGSVLVPIPGLTELQLAKQAGVAAKLGLAATKGAAIGAIANPGDTPNAKPSLQLEQRLNNAGFGAALGAAGEGISQGVQGLPEKLQTIRRWMAAKQLGANKGQVERLLKEAGDETKLDQIERYMDKNGMLRMGTTFSGVADKSAELKDRTGKQIENFYETTQGKLNNNNLQGGLAGQDLAKEFLDAETARLSKLHSGDTALTQIENALGEPGSTGIYSLGQNPDLKDVHKYRISVDDQIPWNADTTGKLKAQSNKKLRSFLNDKMNERVSALDKLTGEDNLSKLQSLNSDYSNAATINSITTKTKAGEMSKYVPGLVGTVGGMGAGAYAHEHGKSLPEAALFALGTGLALRGARAVAPALSYQSAKFLQPAAQGAANYMEQNPIGAQMLVSPWTIMNQERKK